MKLRSLIRNVIRECLNENKIEQLKNTALSVFNNKIEGRFLDKKQSEELQREIEANYYNSDEYNITQLFKKDDIRKNVYNYDNPIAEKDVNGVNLRIAEGLIRDNRKTYLLYADGKIIGEFYSVKDIKRIVQYIEDNLIKKSLR